MLTEQLPRHTHYRCPGGGKHVLCEKPLAPTVEEIRQMIAVDRGGKLLMTGHHFRFTGTAKALKAEINAGEFGEIYHSGAFDGG